MSKTQHVNRIDYVELPAKDIAATKLFYETVFGWKFEDYGPDYTSFHDGRLGGGFEKRDTAARGLLLVIYSTELAGMQKKIENAGGKIVKATFSFPGGRRFHFVDPTGNELAVWSDVE
jgi:uncharacterized protein